MQLKYQFASTLCHPTRFCVYVCGRRKCRGFQRQRFPRALPAAPLQHKRTQSSGRPGFRRASINNKLSMGRRGITLSFGMCAGLLSPTGNGCIQHVRLLVAVLYRPLPPWFRTFVTKTKIAPSSRRPLPNAVTTWWRILIYRQA